MNRLTPEQIEEIIAEYGSSKLIITKIENILSVHNFTDEQYIEIIIEIVSEYETNKTRKQTNCSNTFASLKDIIIKVLKYKLKENMENNNAFYEEMENVLNYIYSLKKTK